MVHRLTGVAPTVALHIPWDRVDDFRGLAKYAAEQGVALGTVNANVFQDNDYRLGSVTNPDPPSAARRSTTCWSASTSWTPRARATSSCGSRTAPTTRARTTSGRARTGSPRPSREVYDRISDDQRIVLEYKLFEPAFYTTDVPDWGTSYAHCLELGPKAQVVIDTGHHAPGTNIEFIVAFLLRAGRLGAFDFNSRFYADDDLMVGAADPFQLFRILHEVRPGRCPRTGARASPTCSTSATTSRRRSRPVIRSVMNVQEATAKALLVDAAALATAQRDGDVLGANAVLMDAYNTDVRPLLAEVRTERGPRPRSRCRLPPLGLLRAHPHRARRRPAGRLGRLRPPRRPEDQDRP